MRRTLRTMAKMSEAQSRKTYRKILRRAAKPMLDDMRLNAPTADNDNILNNISITTAKKWTGAGDAVRVGVVRNKTRNLPNFSAQALASAIEYGTIQRYRSLKRSMGIVTGGSSTGKVRPKPFIRPAYDRNINGLIHRVESDIEKEVQKSAR